ncbi:MAG: ATP-grasp domain-containing protein [Planctomycetia bacterium]|nr:ATP-grasp domain-containing protein [Planctomycetia bacterium]
MSRWPSIVLPMPTCGEFVASTSGMTSYVTYRSWRASLIEQLTEQRTLLGNAPAVLRRVRDPWLLAAALNDAGLQAPQLKRLSEVPVAGQWLRKPVRAAGGYGVEGFVPAQLDNADNSMYLQEFIPGRSIGATFVAANGNAIFVGATEQLLGPAWGGAREFQYVGSVGPIGLSPEHAQALSQVGHCIATSFGIQGLFGVDAIVNGEGVWPVEVNPRYTASVEILERAMNIATIQWHVAACRAGRTGLLATALIRSSRTSRRLARSLTRANPSSRSSLEERPTLTWKIDYDRRSLAGVRDCFDCFE